ncbi:MAG: aminotransferase class I/II-fold pyridoxal phosphate-dependent enzyme [Bacteroidota bacterium]
MIKLTKPYLDEAEKSNLLASLEDGWVSSAGPLVEEFETQLGLYTGVRHAIATNSGTSALHIALKVCGVRENDLVIAPDLTFVAPIHAIYYNGAEPILIDVEEHFWQMDLDLLEWYLEKNTRLKEGECFHKASGRRISAILAVHALGNMGKMERLISLSARYHIPVVEDAAEAIGSWYQGKHAGTFASLGCLSFNGNKLITTGAGGAILTQDPLLAQKVRLLINHSRVSPIPYYHEGLGYNYKMSNLHAAVGIAQLAKLETLLQLKKQLISAYQSCWLSSTDHKIESYFSLKGATPNYWWYAVRVGKKEITQKELAGRGVETGSLWVPMHLLPINRKVEFVTLKNCTDLLHTEAIVLPSHQGVKRKEAEMIAQCVLQINSRQTISN